MCVCVHACVCMCIHVAPYAEESFPVHSVSLDHFAAYHLGRVEWPGITIQYSILL